MNICGCSKLDLTTRNIDKWWLNIWGNQTFGWCKDVFVEQELPRLRIHFPKKLDLSDSVFQMRRAQDEGFSEEERITEWHRDCGWMDL